MTTPQDWLHELDDEGKCPTDRAIGSGNQALIGMVLSIAGAPMVPAAEASPLHAAVYEHDIPVARALLDEGANPDAFDDWGLAPLHWGVIAGSVDLCKLLINRGAQADILSPLSPELTPLSIARLMGYTDLQRILQQHTAY